MREFPRNTDRLGEAMGYGHVTILTKACLFGKAGRNACGFCAP